MIAITGRESANNDNQHMTEVRMHIGSSYKRHCIDIKLYT